MKEKYRILTVNPGSTSTKVALFEEDEALFMTTVEHESAVPGPVQEQLAYRKAGIVREVRQRGYGLEEVDVFAGRGGSMYPCPGGIYEVNEKMLEDARSGPFGEHPARLSCQIVEELKNEYGGKACIVDPPDTDELAEPFRLTGIKEVYNRSAAHALNQKAVGRMYAKEQGTRYEALNLIIAHIGGGVSVTAHEKGRMIDTNDILHGSGPIAPTRCGDIAPGSLIDLCFSGKYTKTELHNLTHKNGGLTALLGTPDIRKIRERIEAGDGYARLCLDSMIASIAKCIGQRAVALKGEVDQILFTGGAARDSYVVEGIKKYVSWIAPVSVRAGELEMQALAAGALRWLRKEEEPENYTGRPVWHMDGAAG